MKSNRKIVFAGMFAAVLAVLAQIQIPMPSGMPFTLQTYAVALMGFMLGVSYAIAAVGIYVLLGMAGVPVFSGLSGGPGVLLGITGGFIWGFFFLAAACGRAGTWDADINGRLILIWKKLRRMLLPAAGLAACHLLGILQFSVIMKMNPVKAALLVSVPYLLKDILSVIAAYMTMKAVRRRMGDVLFRT